MRKLDRRTKTVLAVAAVAAVAVNAGAAWAYWAVQAQTTTTAQAATIEGLDVTAGTGAGSQLYPGATTALSFTVTNRNAFPVVVNGLAPDRRPVTVDSAHDRCPADSVSLTDSLFVGSWRVGAGQTGTFSIPQALTMASGTPQTCAGATFTIPVKVVGVSGS